MRVEEKVFINRTAALVFTFVTDLENEPRWRSNTMAVDVAGPVGLGSEGHTDFRFMGRAVDSGWRVVEFEENALLCVEYSSGVRGGRDRYRLEPFGLYGMTLTVEVEIAAAGLLGLMTPALRPGLKTQLQRDLFSLKRILENR